MAVSPLLLNDVTAETHLAALKTHPSWVYLDQRFRDAFEKEQQRAGLSLLTHPDAFDQRRADERRGYWKGVFDVLNTHDWAERRIEKTLLNDGKETP